MAKTLPVSIKQLAKMANLSTATISRVLNNTGRFSDQTRDLVLSLARKTGYAPNVAAKALRTRTARAIGLVVPDIANEFFALMANAIERHFSERAYSLFICDSGEDGRRVRPILADLRGKDVNGMIYISRMPLSPDTFDAPVVFLDRVPRKGNGLAKVSSDNYMGGRLAAGALMAAGSRRPVMLCYPDDLRRIAAVHDRMQGFEEALGETGVAWSRDRVILSSLSIPESREAVRRALAEGMRFDGLFASSDTAAIGAMFGLEDSGLSVPDDVNVVGFDDISFGAYCKPPVTTIRQNAAAMGTEAAKLLLEMMEGRPAAGRDITVPVELVVRGSTRAGVAV